MLITGGRVGIGGSGREFIMDNFRLESASGFSAGVTASNDFERFELNRAVASDVLGNDANALRVLSITQPSNGTAVLDLLRGTITYTPSADFTGTDSLEYTVLGEDGVSTDTGRLTLSYSPTLRPQAVDDSFTINQRELLSFRPRDNDITVPGQTLVVGDLTQPANGIAYVTNPSRYDIEYVPNPDFVGTDTFTYLLGTGNGDPESTDIGTVTVTVVAAENFPPLAEDRSYTTESDMPITMDVVRNQEDPDFGDSVSLDSIATPPANGQAVATVFGSIIYTPNPGFAGTDALVFTLIDSFGNTANATATITVEGDGGEPSNNVAPLISFASNPLILSHDDGPVQLSGFMTLNPVESGQSIASVDLTYDAAAYSEVLSGSPTANTSGDLTVQTDPEKYGTIQLTVTVTDSGTPAGVSSSVLTIEVRPDRLTQFRIDNAMATDGSDDMADFSGNGIANIAYFASGFDRVMKGDGLVFDPKVNLLRRCRFS